MITSPQSMVFGVIPVAVLGLAFYVAAVPLFSPWAWRLEWRELNLLRLVSVVIGMGFVVYLIYAELYQIRDICEYCTGVHIVTFLLFCHHRVQRRDLGPRHQAQHPAHELAASRNGCRGPVRHRPACHCPACHCPVGPPARCRQPLPRRPGTAAGPTRTRSHPCHSGRTSTPGLGG